MRRPSSRPYPRRRYQRPTAWDHLYNFCLERPFAYPAVLAVFTYIACAAGIPLFATHQSVSVTGPWSALGALVGGTVISAGLAAVWERRQRRELAKKVKTLRDLEKLTWRQFEIVVAQAYREQGWHARATGLGGPDGGIDVVIRKNKDIRVVQCKHWDQEPVGEPLVRQLQGAINDRGLKTSAQAGIFVTTSSYTTSAVEFARRNNIELVDSKGVLRLLAPVLGTTPEEQQTTVSQLAGDQSAPRCPRCGSDMVLRTNSRDGNKFLGCTKYPACRGTQNLPSFLD